MKRPWVISIFSLLIASILVGWYALPFYQTTITSTGVLQVYAQSDTGGTVAYQECIPNGEGSETGLQVFPPKLQIGGKDNWLAVQDPDGLDVAVGTEIKDNGGHTIAINPYSGESYIDIATGNLILSPSFLSDKCKYDIEISDYTLYGGEYSYDEEIQKGHYSPLRATFKSYVSGSGSDLYEIENTPQYQEELTTGVGKEITSVTVSAIVKGEGQKSEASTGIQTYGKKFNGETVKDIGNEDTIINTVYSTNPETNLPWTWEEIDGLQVGITLKQGQSSYVYARIELVVHSQTFFPITKVEVTPGSAGSYQDVDCSSYIPEGSTGVILHVVHNAGTGWSSVGVRKDGSTDDLKSNFYYGNHCWAGIGVDEDREFEAYVGSTTYYDIYLVAYTVSGVTFFTNSYNKQLSSESTWEDIDCSTEAPSATGLFFMQTAYSGGNLFGLRMNGSSDALLADTARNYTFGAIIGCDGGQICEGYAEEIHTIPHLVGFITDGATFNTNATDLSLGSSGSWTDLSSLPAGAIMGFIDVTAASSNYFGLRKNGESEDIYQRAFYHSWGMVECDDSQIIEGKIDDTDVYFSLIGYATAPGGSPEITNTPDNKSFGILAVNTSSATAINHFQIENVGVGAVDVDIQGTDLAGGDDTWDLDDGGTPGENIYGLYAGLDDDDDTFDVIVREAAAFNELVNNLLEDATQNWGLKIYMPTSVTGYDGQVMTASVTLLVSTH